MSMEVNNNSDDYINNDLLLVKKIIDTFNAHNNKLVSNQHNKNTISPYKNDAWDNVSEEKFRERKRIFEKYERFDFIPLINR